MRNKARAAKKRVSAFSGTPQLGVFAGTMALSLEAVYNTAGVGAGAVTLSTVGWVGLIALGTKLMLADVKASELVAEGKAIGAAAVNKSKDTAAAAITFLQRKKDKIIEKLAAQGITSGKDLQTTENQTAITSADAEADAEIEEEIAELNSGEVDQQVVVSEVEKVLTTLEEKPTLQKEFDDLSDKLIGVTATAGSLDVEPEKLDVINEDLAEITKKLTLDPDKLLPPIIDILEVHDKEISDLTDMISESQESQDLKNEARDKVVSSMRKRVDDNGTVIGDLAKEVDAMHSIMDLTNP
jgi:hypothetical protein